MVFKGLCYIIIWLALYHVFDLAVTVDFCHVFANEWFHTQENFLEEWIFPGLPKISIIIFINFPVVGQLCLQKSCPTMGKQMDIWEFYGVIHI